MKNEEEKNASTKRLFQQTGSENRKVKYPKNGGWKWPRPKNDPQYANNDKVSRPKRAAHFPTIKHSKLWKRKDKIKAKESELKGRCWPYHEETVQTPSWYHIQSLI